MTRAVAHALLIATAIGSCARGGAPPPTAPTVAPPPRLRPPPAIDPHARGAAYLTSVALPIQQGWATFLDDCRLRLPPNHPLNQTSLAATAVLRIEPNGQVAIDEIAGSGLADFDRAIRDVIADAVPFPPPPQELLSDDNRAHVRWLFARDHRQAGPATAEVVELELPLATVTASLLARGELDRVARRLLRVRDPAVRAPETERLMIAVIDQGLTGHETAARRAALFAARKLALTAFAPAVATLVASVTDRELRRAAIDAAVALHDDGALVPLRERVNQAVVNEAASLAPELDALIALGDRATAIAVVTRWFDGAATPSPAVLDAVTRVGDHALSTRARAFANVDDPDVRAATCAAVASGAPEVAASIIERGLHDATATVRARCADAVSRIAASGTRVGSTLVSAVRVLANDRDDGARASAVRALVRLDRNAARVARDDRAAVVRAAWAADLGHLGGAPLAELRELLEDRQPDVRASAWRAALVRPDPALSELALHAVDDPSADVRELAVGALDNSTRLRSLSTSDPSPVVRSAAEARLAPRVGRAELEERTLWAVGHGGLPSEYHVQAALAYLLAH